jgi:hypothetical protein
VEVAPSCCRHTASICASIAFLRGKRRRERCRGREGRGKGAGRDGERGKEGERGTEGGKGEGREREETEREV